MQMIVLISCADCDTFKWGQIILEMFWTLCMDGPMDGASVRSPNNESWPSNSFSFLPPLLKSCLQSIRESALRESGFLQPRATEKEVFCEILFRRRFWRQRQTATDPESRHKWLVAQSDTAPHACV